MGVCGSEQKRREKVGGKKHEIKESNKKEKKKEEKILSLETENLLLLKSDYILSLKDSKREDITKYYKLSSEIIGEGTGGTVCTGENSLGTFAIKRINKDKLLDIESLMQEVKYSKLNHPNIIKYYDIFEDLKTISFVMELGDGGDLFDFILNSPLGKLTVDLTLDLLIQILDVLKFLHNEVKIIHRDLKPENFMILIGENDRPIIKLIDFGYAIDIPENNKLLFEVVGTLSYSSPELLNKFGYNEKIDIWSLGIIIFNMLTGLEPFNNDTDSQLESQIKFKKIQFDFIDNEQMRDLVRKMLERNPHKRISANEAFDIVSEIKKERDLEYEKEMCKNIEENE